jgi:hypothetical protein
MHTTETCLDQPSPFANSFALLSFGARRDGGKLAGGSEAAAAALAQEADRHAQESALLLRQISAKAPQLASVLDQLHEGGVEFVERDEQPSQPSRGESLRRFNRGSLLDVAAGFLSHAFPANAPLFHGCRAFLQLKMIKNKKQA